MGSTLEALQYIGQNKIKNILLTIDNNNSQVTGETKNIIDILPVIEMVKKYNWNVFELDGHDEKNMKKTLLNINYKQGPILINFLTKKGYGIKYMEKDPVEWHYKPMNTNEI